jgi:hypothetical protein
LNAEYVHIIYKEFLPAIIGDRIALRPLEFGFIHSYDINVVF